MISDIQAELLELLMESSVEARKRELSTDQPHNVTDHTGDESERFFRASYTILNDQPKLLEHASAVLDGAGASALKSVSEYTDEQSGQTFYKVASSSKDKDYLCMSNYCSCQSYLQMAKSSEALIVCKHMMAVKLALATGQYNQRVMKRDAYLLGLVFSH